MVRESMIFRLIHDLRLQDVRGILFPYPDPSPDQYLSDDLLLNLPTTISVPEVVDDTLDLIRDMTYTIIEYERSHRVPSSFTDLLHKVTIQAAKTGHLVMTDVLLHSGGNLMAIYDDLAPLTTEVEGLDTIVDKYFPGVWNSVETGNIHDLRRLINYWCSTDIEYSGQSLIDLAKVNGNEAIIRLVLGSHYTLKLIHSMFGGNVSSMEKLLKDHLSSIQLDFKHMSDFGAPILHYAIMSNNVEMVSLLIRNGCKIYSLMACPFNPNVEVPAFYSALTNPTLDAKMMAALLSQDGQRLQTQDLLYRMTFEGKSCLEVSLNSGLNVESFKVLLVAGGGRLLSDRNADCLTIRDVAQAAGRKDYVDAIDEYVIECLQKPDSHLNQRKILALFGYDISDVNLQEPPIDSFYSRYGEYQGQIKKLSMAIEKDDLETFIKCSKFEDSEEPLFEPLLTWEGRGGKENPLPLLHLAVIFNRPRIVSEILKSKPPGHSVDMLLDHMRRTPLHYAYAMNEFSGVVTLIRESGCSDHVQDRNGKEPLDFKELVDDSVMEKVITRLRFADFSSPEPNPWKGWKKRRAKMLEPLGEEEILDDEEDEEEEGQESLYSLVANSCIIL